MKSFSEFLIYESRLERLHQHIEQHHPFVIISSDRSDATKQENNDNFKEFKRRLKLTKFGYNRVRGGFVEDNGNEVYERSLIVYGKAEDEQRLKNFAIAIGVKFNQDGILFVDSKGNAKIISTKDNGPIGDIGDVDEIGNKLSTNNIEQFFTKIGHKRFHFVKSDPINESDEFEDCKEYDVKPSTLTGRFIQSRFNKMLDQHGYKALSILESELHSEPKEYNQ